uniref:Uncharacterized protein n=1 Tax=Siphoviridae sp. ctFH16 TaxID=2827817 RepID=A0A8S5TN64_9CAUD|nr:MAG TPA: hypothetical protein [Siphoviridae sp. ctFH16]
MFSKGDVYLCVKKSILATVRKQFRSQPFVPVAIKV